MTLTELIAKWTDQADYYANKRFHCENCGIKASAIKEMLADLREMETQEKAIRRQNEHPDTD